MTKEDRRLIEIGAARLAGADLPELAALIAKRQEKTQIEERVRGVAKGGEQSFAGAAGGQLVHPKADSRPLLTREISRSFSQPR